MAAKAAVTEAVMDLEQELEVINQKIIEETKQLQEKQRQIQLAEGRKKQIIEDLKVMKHTLSILETTQPKQQIESSTIQAPIRKKQYWVISNGPMAGVYDEWAKVQPLVIGTPYGHKKYESLTEAKEALQNAKQATIMAQHLENINQQTQNRVSLRRIETQIQKIPQIAHLTINKIPTLSQINSVPKITKAQFHTLWNSLMNYKDEDQIHSYYPVYRQRIGPKAIILPEATGITTAQYFYAGLIDCIYMMPHTQYRQLSHFPHTIQNAVKQFFDKRAKERTVYLRVFSALPF
ncbi:hypothetical protein PIB30_012815 [Stylosanthes scabra]|uniref:Ribonuclease H1 N-terminal domain-containing protein n=1 Tax=Stylosanthes scabra TaxID=79078 RepID=A0ABU6U648_9FABA|nr:hypothetical protein [Stylosanthes scabra]